MLSYFFFNILRCVFETLPAGIAGQRIIGEMIGFWETR